MTCSSEETLCLHPQMYRYTTGWWQTMEITHPFFRKVKHQFSCVLKITSLQFKNQVEQDLTPARSLVTLCTRQETPGQQSYRLLG